MRPIRSSDRGPHHIRLVPKSAKAFIAVCWRCGAARLPRGSTVPARSMRLPWGRPPPPPAGRRGGDGAVLVLASNLAAEAAAIPPQSHRLLFGSTEPAARAVQTGRLEPYSTVALLAS